jgi:hypothetical protein
MVKIKIPKVKTAAAGLKLRNHVTPRSRQIQGQLATKFGIEIGDLINAMMGDNGASKKLGEMARQGRMMSEFAPIIAEKAKEAIAGTQAFNQALGEINIASGQASTAIDRIADSAELADVRWTDDRTLRLADFNNQKERQSIATDNAEKYITMKAEIDKHMQTVDGNYKMLQLELRPEISDVQLQEAHTIEMAKYNLEMGNKAIDRHKPVKQYGGSKIVSQIKEALFGF